MTFLFADIEGADLLWGQDYEWMRDRAARHRQTVEAVVADHGGATFSRLENGFCAMFLWAADAVASAIDIQSKLLNDPARVRIAIHTGRAQAHGQGFEGPAVERAERLLEASHGGQVLLTEEALASASKSRDLQTSDLGVHRLRDQKRARRIFQIGNALFPPLKSESAETPPNNLPRQTTSFVGRAKETQEIEALVGDRCLVSLVGAGGCGKTRLAIECGFRLLRSYQDGVWFVDFAGIAEGDLVAQTVLQTLGVRETPDGSLAPAIAAKLEHERALLIFDNCEHVLEAAGELIQLLVERCGGVQILTTSREAIHVSGEHVYRVPSLSTPTPSNAITVAELNRFEAPRLFVERALLTKTDLVLTDTTAPILASICVKLDGIPLAIELAAARARTITLGEMDGMLESAIRLLVGGPRSATPRQQTLRGLIEWSYKLLSESERQLFRALSVFAGGWTLDAAKKVCFDGGIDSYAVLDLLQGLCDKSVVSVSETKNGARYSMLVTVRQFAAERLQASGEEAVLRKRHCEWIVNLTRNGRALLGEPESESWTDLIDVEQDNIRSALGWALKNAQSTDAALFIAGAVAQFWYQRGFGLEARQWVHRALAAIPKPADPYACLLALETAIGLAGYEGDEASLAKYRDQLEVAARVANDPYFLAVALDQKGRLSFYHRGELEISEGDFLEALELFKGVPGGERAAFEVQLNLGTLAYARGRFEEAKQYIAGPLELIRKSGDEQSLAIWLYAFASVANDAMEFERAERAFLESLSLARKLRMRTLEVNITILLSRLHLDCGRAEEARIGYERALFLSLDTKDRLREPLARTGLARALAELGLVERSRQELKDWDFLPSQNNLQLQVDRLFAASTLAFAGGSLRDSALLLGATMGYRERIPWVVPPTERHRWNRLELRLRDVTPSQSFGEELFEGRGMLYEEAGDLWSVKGT